MTRIEKVTVRVRETWTQCVHCQREYKDNRNHCFYCEKETAERGKWVVKTVPECIARQAYMFGTHLQIVRIK